MLFYGPPMNRCRFLLLFSLVGLTTPALACMNDYVPNVVAIERSRTVLEQLQKHVLKEPWETRRDRLRKELAAGGDYRVKNDLATALAHTGDAAEAVTLLEQIEAEKPGLYVTAANLGTAYELAGNNEKALEWIRKGIERNARAHQGTEWLHVRILEAKLALRDDPMWLESNSIVGQRKKYGGVEVYAVGNRGEKLSLEQIKGALVYQLHERLQFVNPPDAIVGELLLDLGTLLGHEPSGLGGAYDVFKLAAEYFGDLPNVDSLRLNAHTHLRGAAMGQRTSVERFYKSLPFVIGLGCLLSAAVVSMMRRTQRKRSNQEARGAA